jgi:nucleoside-diphosphate-sugar epimerase
MTPRILLLGATGYIGKRLSSVLSKNYPILTVARRCSTGALLSISYEQLLDKSGCAELSRFAPTHVVHCAGIAHKSPPRNWSQWQELYSVNVDLPLRAAVRAKSIGVRRFIFVSSVGVHGNCSRLGGYINEASPFLPSNPYASSKLLAENVLRAVFDQSSCELVILRPALVYGPHAPGSLRLLVRLVEAGLPLALVNVKNQRSLIALDNLVSAIEAVILHPKAAGQAYVVADQETVSTEDLVRLISMCRGRNPLIFYLPLAFLGLCKRIPALGVRVSQLADSLVVDSSKFRKDLGWTQPLPQPSALLEAFSCKIS